MNKLRRVQGFAYPTEASRSADVKTREIPGKEPGVPKIAVYGQFDGDFRH